MHNALVPMPQKKIPVSQLLQTGTRFHQQGNFNKAEKTYRLILARQPDNADANHLLGLIAYQVGKHDIAAQLIKKALQSFPNFPAAHNHLGLILKELNLFEEAIESWKKALTIKPDFMDAYNNLSCLLQQCGQFEEAMLYCKKALAIKPDYANAYNNLAIAQNELGQTDGAIASCKKAIAIDPGFANAHNNLATFLKAANRPGEALEYCKKALELQPDFVQALFNLGTIQQESNQLHQAIDSYQKILKLKPGHAPVHNNLGTAFQNIGSLDKAIEHFKQAATLQPDLAEAHNNLGTAYKNSGQPDKALSCYQKALAINPDYADAHNNLGVVLQQSGQLDKAVVHYRKALLAKPDFAEVYAHIAAIKKYSEADADIRAMEKIFNSKKSSDRQKALIGFSLGKAFENLKQHGKSFQFLKKANHLHRSSYSYSISNESAAFNKIKTICSKEFFSAQDDLQQEESENSAARPIFILGMPRSGTTLVEQIIASHPYVFGAGELNTLFEVLNNLCRQKNSGQFPEGLAGLDQNDFKRLGSAYLKKLAAYRSRDERYITDKMPHHFLLIGLIKKILPWAKVIHCKRDPMDTCFSIFKTFFSIKNSHPYAYEMTELGHYYNLYADLMRHWSNLLPDFVYDIEYEKLVTDQEEQTRKLLSYCGLPWDDACLWFHKTRRRVATASSVQVRQPMYKDSIKLWKQHAKQLEPLSRAIHG